MIVFPVEIEAEAIVDSVFEAEIVTDPVVLQTDVATTINVAERVPTYDGAYEFTPSDSEQVIQIEEKKATANIVINPIPEGWGKITWDGSVLTVS